MAPIGLSSRVRQLTVVGLFTLLFGLPGSCADNDCSTVGTPAPLHVAARAEDKGMSDLSAILRRRYPTAIFDPPCTAAEIAEAEQLLGQPLPAELRHLYLHFNGFWMWRRGLAIFPLLPRHANTSAVGITQFWKTDPYMPVKDNVFFFGSTSKEHCLGIRMTPPQVVVEYDPRDAEEPQVVARTLLEALAKDDAWVESLHQPPPLER